MRLSNGRTIAAHIKFAQEQGDAPFVLYPQKDRLNEVHFSIFGPDGSPYEGGIYHGVIKCSARYPYEGPEVVFLQPSGRFEVGEPVCLSYRENPGLWSPSTGLYGLLCSLQSVFMDEKLQGTAIIADPDLALVSECREKCRCFVCPQCGCDHAEL